jgi:proteasome lid subunit RPN8/RPN11
LNSKNILLVYAKNDVVWISHETLSQMLIKAERSFPNETGGVIIGYWVKLYEEAVITQTTGPGPRAIHYLATFLLTVNIRKQKLKIIIRHPEGSILI